MGFFDKLKQGLSKTKSSFEEKMNNVFSNFRKVDEDLLEELEEALILSDVGVETSTEIISNLRTRIKKEKIEASDKDITEKLEEMAKNYGKEAKELEQNEALKNYLKGSLETEKAIEFVVKNAKIK